MDTKNENQTAANSISSQAAANDKEIRDTLAMIESESQSATDMLRKSREHLSKRDACANEFEKPPHHATGENAALRASAIIERLPRLFDTLKELQIKKIDLAAKLPATT